MTARYCKGMFTNNYKKTIGAFPTGFSGPALIPVRHGRPRQSQTYFTCGECVHATKLIPLKNRLVVLKCALRRA